MLVMLHSFWCIRRRRAGEERRVRCGLCGQRFFPRVCRLVVDFHPRVAVEGGGLERRLGNFETAAVGISPLIWSCCRHLGRHTQVGAAAATKKTENVATKKDQAFFFLRGESGEWGGEKGFFMRNGPPISRSLPDGGKTEKKEGHERREREA